MCTAVARSRKRNCKCGSTLKRKDSDQASFLWHWSSAIRWNALPAYRNRIPVHWCCLGRLTKDVIFNLFICIALRHEQCHASMLRSTLIPHRTRSIPLPVLINSGFYNLPIDFVYITWYQFFLSNSYQMFEIIATVWALWKTTANLYYSVYAKISQVKSLFRKFSMCLSRYFAISFIRTTPKRSQKQLKMEGFIEK